MYYEEALLSLSDGVSTERGAYYHVSYEARAGAPAEAAVLCHRGAPSGEDGAPTVPTDVASGGYWMATFRD